MLEQVNLKLSVPKAEYRERLTPLQDRLFDLEHAVFQARIPALTVIEGWGCSGKGGVVQVLAERMDPRGFQVHSITPPRTYETRYPWLWRFWLKVPAYGQITTFNESWNRRVLIDRVARTIGKGQVEEAFQDILDFERQLADDGTAILKCFLHISHQEQARRFKRLRSSKLTGWQVTEEDALQHRRYEQYLAAAEEMLARTEAAHAPWVIVEATDRYHCRLKVLEMLARTLEARLGALAPPERGTPAATAARLAERAEL